MHGITKVQATHLSSFPSESFTISELNKMFIDQLYEVKKRQWAFLRPQNFVKSSVGLLVAKQWEDPGKKVLPNSFFYPKVQDERKVPNFPSTQQESCLVACFPTQLLSPRYSLPNTTQFQRPQNPPIDVSELHKIRRCTDLAF